MNQNSWIRKKRKFLGISQYKMAKALEITSQELSGWELNKVKPSSSKLKIVKDFFNNPQKYLKKNGVSLKKKTFKRVKEYSKTKYPSQKKLETFYKRFPNENVISDHRLNAVMLFSGIGGMSLGFQNAGFNIIGHVEINETANKIYHKNFPCSQLIGQDIKSISDKQVLEFKNKNKEITIIAGGPPCQGFSLAGKRNVYDPRNELFREFVRFTRLLLPKFIVLENVKMLRTMRSKTGGYVKDYIMNEFDKIGYKTIWSVVNVKNYGVPQSRERIIFIGIRKDLEENVNLKFPSVTHLEGNNLFNKGNAARILTFRDATIDLERLESGQSSKKDPWHFAIMHPEHVIEMLKNVPEGSSAHDNPDPKLRPSSGYNTTYKRLKWDEPSSTISTNFSMISGSRNVHPSDTRSITIREAMRCQTFPDTFRLVGSLGEIRKGIGNAVPPHFAEILAKHIKLTLKDDKSTQLLD